MKPISYWLNTIKDPEIRKRAIANMESSKEGVNVWSLNSAMIAAFDITHSQEGGVFWVSYMAMPTKSFDELKHLIKP